MGNGFQLFLLVLTLVIGVSVRLGEARLSYNYYDLKCPNLETIVRREVSSIFVNDATAPAFFLRLLFHDCQVQGCDASILLDSDGSRVTSEMVSSKNFGIKRRELIGKIKYKLEKECPGQVSCADIIALGARESVLFSGGPNIRIHLGRQDSTTSSPRQADALIPPPSLHVQGLLEIFLSKGMNLEESVAILGAHTLGVGHCVNIVERLYKPQANNWMELSFEAQLRLFCPTAVPLTNQTSVPNDITPLVFDNQYYRDVLAGRGLFGIDSKISRDPRTAAIVRQFAVDQGHFFQAFSSAFVKLSVTNVLTKGKGEVRRQCNRVN